MDRKLIDSIKNMIEVHEFLYKGVSTLAKKMQRYFESTTIEWLWFSHVSHIVK